MTDLTHPTATLSVELEIGSEPIRGSVHRSERPAVPFTGWLELTGMLERAHEGQLDPAPSTAAAGVLQRYFSRVRAGDWDAAFALLADDVVLHVPGRSSLAGVHRGRAAAIAYVRAAIARSHAEEVEIELIDLLASEERAALIVCERFHRDGAVTEILRANVYRVAAGEIVEVHVFEGDQAAADALFGSS